jgi:hypothetical protein
MLKRNPSIVQVTKRLSEEKHRGLREISAVRDLLLSQANHLRPMSSAECSP